MEQEILKKLAQLSAINKNAVLSLLETLYNQEQSKAQKQMKVLHG